MIKEQEKKLEQDAPCAPKLGLREVRTNPKIRVYIEKANEQMAAIGFTEHGIRHAALVAAIARNTLTSLGYPPHTAARSARSGRAAPLRPFLLSA